MSKELKDLEEKLEAMNIEEVHNYINENYDYDLFGTKDNMIKKIIRHEAIKSTYMCTQKTMSESYYGAVTDIKDIGKFVDKAISVFQESNITPISKILVEIDEDLGELVFIRGYNIKVINADLHNEFKIGDINE